MMRYIILVMVFISSLYANFEVSYLDDKKEYSDITQLFSKKFTSIPSKKSFGLKKSVWLKTTILNDKNLPEENYLSITNLQIMEDVHFYTVLNNKLIKQDLAFNKYTNPHVSSRIGNSLIYQNSILAKEKIDVYVHITAKSNIYVEVYAGELNEVMDKLSNNGIVLVFLIGALFALGVYYGFLYIFTPNKEYSYYTLFTISLALFSLYAYGGYANYFDIFWAGPFSNTFIILIPIFTILFFKSIYSSNIEFRKYNYILNMVLVLLFSFLLIYALSSLKLIPYISIGKYGPIIYLIQMFVVMSIAIAIYRKRLPYSGLFLFSYSANFVGSLGSISFFAGVIPYNVLTFHSNLIGGVLEAILFSILLAHRVRNVYQEKEIAINSANVKDIKITVMNDTLNFISHQWRQPLSQINASVITIDNIVMKSNLKFQKIEDELVHIENLTNHMSTTIDDFKNLFSTNKEIEILDLNIAIKDALSVIEKSLDKSSIELELDTQKDIFVKGNMGEITQTLLVIINNAKDVFIERDIQNPKITITSYLQNDIAYLEICDNAGGVAKTLQEKIFDAKFSLKNKTHGSGMGLYITKVLIELKMKGSIVVKNKNEGACFIIKLNIF